MADLLKDATEDARLLLSMGLKYTTLPPPSNVDEYLPRAIFRDSVGPYPLGFVNLAARADDVFCLKVHREWWHDSLNDVDGYKLLRSFGDGGLRVVAGSDAWFVYRITNDSPVVRVIEGEILSKGLRGCTITEAFLFSGSVQDKGRPTSVERFGTLGEVPDALVPLLVETGKVVCDSLAASQ
jgi:hypothetical protein